MLGIGPTPGPGSLVTTASVTTSRPPSSATADRAPAAALATSSTISGTAHTQWCDHANGARAAEASPHSVRANNSCPARCARTASTIVAVPSMAAHENQSAGSRAGRAGH